MGNIYNAKAVLLGAPAVGKTSIRRRYMGSVFETSHLMTIGADFAQKKIKIGNNLVNMQIWDIAGQDQFKKIRSKFLLNSNICLMVFDLTRYETFKEVTNWLQDFWTINPNGNIPLLLIGNKADLENGICVTSSEIKNLIEELKNQNTSTSRYISYIYTSAATGLNINEAFFRVAKQITNIYNKQYSQGSNNSHF